MNKNLLILLTTMVTSFGYVFMTDGDSHIGPRLVVGMAFGVGIAASMRSRPELISNKIITCVTLPLLALLVTWISIYEPIKVYVTIVWALVFLGLQYAYAAQINQDTERSKAIRNG